MQELRIKKASNDHISDIVQIHINSFPGFFLTSLGPGFLTVYYSSALKLNDTILLCAESSSGELLGFVMGTKNASGYHKYLMLKGFYQFIYYLILTILVKPKILFRLLLNLDKNRLPDLGKNYAELLSIAVDPRFEGQGVGKNLLNSFLCQNFDKRVSKLVLTTDRFNNDAVIGFYQKFGFDEIQEFITYPKRHMYRMIKILGDV